MWAGLALTSAGYSEDHHFSEWRLGPETGVISQGGADFNLPADGYRTPIGRVPRHWTYHGAEVGVSFASRENIHWAAFGAAVPVTAESASVRPKRTSKIGPVNGR